MKIFKYLIEAFFIYILFFLFRIIGINYGRKVSSFLLSKVGFFFRKKNIIKKNISNVFKKYSDSQIEDIIKLMWSNYGSVFAEYVYLNKFRSNKFSKKHIKISGEIILDEIIKNNRPVI